MLSEPVEAVRARAERLGEALRRVGVAGEVQEVGAVAGGGSLPGTELPSAAVRLRVTSPERFATALRTGRPAVVARVADGAVWLDARTLTDGELEPLAERVAAVARIE
jgi:L-seryl-tRNA(Ser) seleniumtransferase